MYIEEVKHRLYGEDPTADAAKFCLYEVILTATKMLAPFTPHFAEELYQTHFASDFPYSSIHISEWPFPEDGFIDEEAEELGTITNSIISAIRQFKSGLKMALAQELEGVEIYTPDRSLREKVQLVSKDIAGTMRVKKLKVITRKPELVEHIKSVEPNYPKLGPKLKSDMKLLVKALRKVNLEKVAKELASGKLVIEEFGKIFTLMPEDLRLVKETEIAGERVEVIDIDEPPATILIKL
jgi:valyl-tRNA synthetase